MIASNSRLLAGLALVAGLVEGQAILANPPKFEYGTPNPNMIGVKGRNPNGPSNPATPQLNTPINQTSSSRLASVNSIDDWCTFGPSPVPNTEPLGNIEETTVAYCTKPRNNARVIPDGTLTAVHFVKTPLYVQVMALGDFTKINMAPGDEGGELDPHGATNMGNPVGGNVTSNIADGKTDVFYEEWMNYVSSSQICMRVCIAGTDIAPTPLECQHELDTMGCNFVMPGNYADSTFDSCDGDAAYPPGLFVLDNGSTSTFKQYFTGQYVANGQTVGYTNGAADQTTPQMAASLPATSNCVPHSSIANGIQSLIVSSSSAAPSGMSTAVAPSASSGSNSNSNGNSGSKSNTGSSGSGSASTQGSGASKTFGSAMAAGLVGIAGLAAGLALL